MITPIGARVLVLPDEQTLFWSEQANIIKPDTTRERPQTGVILAAGAVSDSRLAPGCRVIYGKFSGAETHIDGYEFIICREDEIHGIHNERTMAEVLGDVGLTIEKLKKPESAMKMPAPSKLIDTEV